MGQNPSSSPCSSLSSFSVKPRYLLSLAIVIKKVQHLKLSILSFSLFKNTSEISEAFLYFSSAMTAKKSVLQLSVHDERIRKKAFVTVSRCPGVSSITMDDKTGKMTVVGEVDVPVIVMKLRKICNAEIVSVEDVKPPAKKPEPEKPAPPKPAEIVAFPVTHLNYPYQYHSTYANSYYQPQPYGNSRVVVEEPNTCVIM